MSEREFPITFSSEQEELLFRRELEKWTKEYGSIHVIEINDIIFTYRCVTKAEIREAEKLYEDDFGKAEYICRVCTLDPIIDDYELEIFAGIPESLCKAILDASGFTEAQEMKRLMRQWKRELQSAENQIPLLIKEAFQDLSLEEIESWNMEKTIEYFVKGKWILETLRGIKFEDSENEELMMDAEV